MTFLFRGKHDAIYIQREGQVDRAGQKRDKTRITIALATNATGSDRTPLWLIGTAKNPRALLGVMSELLDASRAGTRKHGCAVEVWQNGYARFTSILEGKDESCSCWIISPRISARLMTRRAVQY